MKRQVVLPPKVFLYDAATRFVYINIVAMNVRCWLAL